MHGNTKLWNSPLLILFLVWHEVNMPSFTSLEVRKKLKKFDRRFTFRTGHGNGHQIMIEHPEHGFIPLPDHGSKSISLYVLQTIVRRFNLPKDFFK